MPTQHWFAPKKLGYAPIILVVGSSDMMLVKCAYKGFKSSHCGSGILKKIRNEIFEVNFTWGLDLLGIKNMYLEVFIVGSCLPYVKHHMGLKEYTNCVFVNTNSISNGFFNC